MPRGQYKRVSSNHADQDTTQLEETQDIGWVPVTGGKYDPPHVTIHPIVVHILHLADRVATKYLAGKSGLALENDARAIKEAMDSLPDEVRILL